MFCQLQQNRFPYTSARFVLAFSVFAPSLSAGKCAPLIAGALQDAAPVRSAPASNSPAAAAPPVALSRPLPAASRFTVVLDAAHGGDDSGARFSSTSEKDIALALSVKLRSLLGARGIAVVTTRESDTTVSGDRRAELANHAKAQACLSLHATESGAGVHLFASSIAPSTPARIPAWKTAQSAWVTRSLALAGVVNSSLLQTGLPVTLGRTNLLGVDSMTCPAMAVEIAPDRSQSPPVQPGDTAYQARIAESIAAALLEWRSQMAATEGRPQ